MKKVLFFCFLLNFSLLAYGAGLDINIIYEGSVMKVKETVCGWEPDLSKGYLQTDDDCYQTMYQLDVPMYGFSFEPVSEVRADNVKFAYYISFFDSVIPKDGMVKTEVIKDGEVLREVKNLFHARTFQGLTILSAGETVRFSTEKEPSYIIVYILAAAVIAAGVFLIIRKRK